MSSLKVWISASLKRRSKWSLKIVALKGLESLLAEEGSNKKEDRANRWGIKEITIRWMSLHPNSFQTHILNQIQNAISQTPCMIKTPPPPKGRTHYDLKDPLRFCEYHEVLVIDHRMHPIEEGHWEINTIRISGEIYLEGYRDPIGSSRSID